MLSKKLFVWAFSVLMLWNMVFAQTLDPVCDISAGETFVDKYSQYGEDDSNKLAEEGVGRIDIYYCSTPSGKDVVRVTSVNGIATLNKENFRIEMIGQSLFYPAKEDMTDYTPLNSNLNHRENAKWLAPSSNVEKIVFSNIKLPADSSDLFYGLRTQLEFADNVDTSWVTNMKGMFAYARHFDGTLDTFNTSNVTDMTAMFQGAKTFNHALTFSTTNVTKMSDMFSQAEAFNAELNFDDTSNVTTMKGMFYGAKAFNQPLNFNTSKVTNMAHMFAATEEFNQPLNFDTSKVTNMAAMFLAALKFDQDLSNFDFSSVQDAEGFLANKYIPSDNVEYLKKILATILTQGGADAESQAVIQGIATWLEGNDDVDALPEAVKNSPFKAFYERTLLLTREKMKAGAIGVPYSLEHYDALLKKVNATLKNQNVRMHVQANYCASEAEHKSLEARMYLRDNGIHCFKFKGDQKNIRENVAKDGDSIFDLTTYTTYKTADIEAGGPAPTLTYAIKSGNDKNIFEIKEVNGKPTLVFKDSSNFVHTDQRYEIVITVEDQDGQVKEATFVIIPEKKRQSNGGGTVYIDPTPSTGEVLTWEATTGGVETWEVLTGLVEHKIEDIFNEGIENGKCYTRRDLKGIFDTDKVQTSEEFKKALRFLASYEMTMYDSVLWYDPYRKLTREEAAKIFSNFAINVLCRKPDLNLKTNYSDTAHANETLKPYIELAYQLWVMKGSGKGDGEFRPFDYISKAEVNAVLVRMILKSYLKEDGKKWHKAYDEVSKRLEIVKRWTEGKEGLSRNDLALMLFRAYKQQQFDWQDVDYYSYVLKHREQYIK